MKLTQTTGTILGIVAVVVLAVAFWTMALGPKRDEVKTLDAEVERLEASLAQHESEVAEGEDARAEFAGNYRELVVLGKAVPGDDDTASLLVQLNRIAAGAGVDFNIFILSGEGGEEEAPPPEPAPAEAGAEAAPAALSPTEAIASTMPLGAQIGPAGLAVMPYELTFEGEFFEIADFIKGLDSLVETENAKVAVTGRLLTINGFALKADDDLGFPHLTANFVVSTYLTPPEEGVTGGATPTSPPAAAAAPVATTTGGAP
jgi:hypothetical protein